MSSWLPRLLSGLGDFILMQGLVYPFYWKSRKDFAFQYSKSRDLCEAPIQIAKLKRFPQGPAASPRSGSSRACLTARYSMPPIRWGILFDQNAATVTVPIPRVESNKCLNLKIAPGGSRPIAESPSRFRSREWIEPDMLGGGRVSLIGNSERRKPV
jgi:hypothetical protein